LPSRSSNNKTSKKIKAGKLTADAWNNKKKRLQKGLVTFAVTAPFGFSTSSTHCITLMSGATGVLKMGKESGISLGVRRNHGDNNLCSLVGSFLVFIFTRARASALGRTCCFLCVGIGRTLL
jgi:hypothetical protein